MMRFSLPLVPAKAGTQFRALDSRWSLCSGKPEAGSEYGIERSRRV